MAADNSNDQDGVGATPKRKRRLRAALAADIANFSGRVSVSETRAFGHLSSILKIGREELERHEGDLIGMPGDGLFALFESAVDAVLCALAIQDRLAKETNLGGMKLRIGIHVGDVLFEGDLPFGETLNIAARLESLADPGGILISGTMVDAVSARIQATFEDRGVPSLKNIPRRITTFAVHSADRLSDTDMGVASTALDKTMQLPRAGLSSPSAAEAAASAKQPPAESRSEKAKPSLLQRLETGDAKPVEAAGKPEPDAASEPPGPEMHAKPDTQPAGQTTSKPAESAPVPAPAAVQIPAAAIEEISEALAVHLGPVARVMVNRKAKDATSTNGLIEALASELSSSDERAKFRARLIKLLGR